MEAMNEEYRIYNQNPFRRIWNAIASARRNVMRMESDAKAARLDSEMCELLAIKKRYESDSEREKVLKGIIGGIESRLHEATRESSSSGVCHDKVEAQRLRAALRRRTSELERLRRRMSDDMEWVLISP